MVLHALRRILCGMAFRNFIEKLSVEVKPVMPTITFNKSDQVYLQQCVSDLRVGTVAFGIVIGQNMGGEEFKVVHLAKNREEDIDVTWPEERPSKDFIIENAPEVVISFADINTQFLANQWLSAIRMIPGSFSVLGIFIAARDMDILDESTFQMAKRVLNEIHNILMQSKTFGINTLENDLLFVAYSLIVNKVMCKAYRHSDSNSDLKPVECEFAKQPFQWHTVTCNYEMNEVFPIFGLTSKINIEQQFHDTIETVRHNLEASELLIQNENVNDDVSVEAYVHKKSITNNAAAKTHSHELHVSIILSIECQMRNKANAIRVRLFGGTIRFLGTISSRIYCSPQNTLGDVKRYVRRDVVRSLVARIQVYCDGLTETKISTEAILISRPPRRVYFNLSIDSPDNPIQFSEYIFRNETTAIAVTQVQQTLDLDLKKEHIIDDLEGLPVDETFSDFSTKLQTQRLSSSVSDTTRSLARSMYTLGVAVSLLVLLLSVCLNYLLQI